MKNVTKMICFLLVWKFGCTIFFFVKLYQLFTCLSKVGEYKVQVASEIKELRKYDPLFITWWRFF